MVQVRETAVNMIPTLNPTSASRVSSHESTQIHEMVSRLERWLVREGMASYDSWDLWATSFGGWAKTVFAKNSLLGSFFVGPLLLVDLFFPRARKLFADKRSFPICHAHIGLGYLNLHEVTHDMEYVGKAEALVQPLLAMASPFAKGLGWGMKHDWMTVKGLIPKDTPCHTQTAYAYELFASLHAVTGKALYEDYLAQIASHEANDFPEWQTGETLVSSYSTLDSRKVVNANSYRMLMLLDAGRRFKKQQYIDKGLATLRYVLSMQQADGSWPYAEDQQFVDTYHTCFVLKNLFKSRNNAGGLEGEIDSAIERGFKYYVSHLFDEKGYPVPFAVRPRMVLHKYDSYDLAESIGLLAELDKEPERLRHLLAFAAERFQTKEGWFRFRLYWSVPFKGIPYMRYANSAMFLALTKALNLYHKQGSDGSAD